MEVTHEVAKEEWDKWRDAMAKVDPSRYFLSNQNEHNIKRLLKRIDHRQEREFTAKEHARLEKLLLSNPDFTRLLISLNFPLFQCDIDQYGHLLVFGSDYHSFAQFDEWTKEWFGFAEFGLSFNQNTPLFGFQSRDFWAAYYKGSFKNYPSDPNDLFPYATQFFPLDVVHELVFRRMFKAEMLGRDRHNEERIAMLDFYGAIELIHLFKKMEWTVDEIESCHSTFGLYFALCTYAWKYFFDDYFTNERFHHIMQRLA
jgi:hypothetical protein